MTDRISRSDLEKLFATAFGADAATSHGQVGKYTLDYNAEYGGWRIDRYEASGGESMPFGPERVSLRRMYDFLTGYNTANLLARRSGGAGPRDRKPFSNCVNAGPSRHRRLH